MMTADPILCGQKVSPRALLGVLFFLGCLSLPGCGSKPAPSAPDTKVPAATEAPKSQEIKEPTDTQDDSSSAPISPIESEGQKISSAPKTSRVPDKATPPNGTTIQKSKDVDTAAETPSEVPAAKAMDQASESKVSKSDAQPPPVPPPVAPMDPWIERFLEVAQDVPNRRAKRAVKAVLANPSEYRFQIIVTEVAGLGTHTPTFIPHEYRVDDEYFYPASAMKLYGSIAALMEWTKLSAEHPWISPNDSMSFGRTRCGQKDKTNVKTGLVTLGHEIKKTQLVSSNAAFNRVFNAVGMDTLHDHILPYFPSVRVYHRLSTRETRTESMKTPTMTVCNTSKKGTVKKKAKRFVRKSFTAEGKNAPIKAAKTDPYTGYRENFESFQIGDGHKDIKTKKPVDTPMDFSEKNRVSFYDFQRAIMAIQFPKIAPPFGTEMDLHSRIKKPWMNALRRSMAIYPRHSDNPIYTKASLSETRFKPLITGVRMAKVKDDSIYYLNKAGKAYGFHVDNAFIAQGKGGARIGKDGQSKGRLRRGLIITVGVYVNEDRVLNNDKYQYKKTSVPFLNAMGYAVGRYLAGDARFKDLK